MPELSTKETIENLGVAFEKFKSTNDERLAKLEKGEKDPLLEEKLSRIEQDVSLFDGLKSQIDELEKKAGRPGRTSDDAATDEHKTAFDKFMRKGTEDGLEELQQKAVSVGVDGDGGYAVPETLDKQIEKFAKEFSPMRQVCRVMTMNNESYKKLVSTGGASSGWVDETETRLETGTPNLVPVTPKFGEIYANPAATQKSLDDLMFNVDGWLAEEVAEEFADQEGAAFLLGDGNKKPMGMLAGTLSTDPDSSRALGVIQYLLSGVDAGINGDNLIDLIHAVKSRYRRNSSFMMSGLSLAAIRKLKDGDQNYIWRPGLEAGVPSSLLSYNVVENDDMPDPGAESNSISFGDYKRAYYIIDIRGTRVLRDPYTRKGYVQFYTTKRVGGMLVNSEAIKVLRLGDGV